MLVAGRPHDGLLGAGAVRARFPLVSLGYDKITETSYLAREEDAK